MNEAETRAELIDPALKAAGWAVVPESRVGHKLAIYERKQAALTELKQSLLQKAFAGEL